MGCIETREEIGSKILKERLTLTWDVLKLDGENCTITENGINFNMGCIETREEIGSKILKERLTLTWDVLKLKSVLLQYGREY